MKNQPVPPKPNNVHPVTMAIWGLLIAMTFITMINFNRPKPETMEFKEFIAAVKDKRVENLVIKDPLTGIATIKVLEPSVTGKPASKEVIVTGDMKSDTFVKIMIDGGVIPNYLPEDRPSLFLQVLASWLPMILIFGFLFFYLRRSAGGMSSFGRARAKPLTAVQEKITFDDVAGVEESKAELQEIVNFLSDPQKFIKIGAKIPKGALLVGPPGTGKTLLARAVAGEAKANFLSIAGSDFVEMFVGVGASRVRDLFQQAQAQSPCIIFIDEIDAVGRARGGSNGLSGGHDEREQTLNQLLVEMDGFDSQKGIIVLAATNRSDVLDNALMRPGRFDRRITVSLPDINGREKILQIHARKTKLAEKVNLREIAKGTPGFSGAELANVINEAALYAATNNFTEITQHSLEEARDKVMMGPQRKSMVITPEEKKTTAYHEAGHTIIAKKLPGLDPIHKVTIIPRGMALGVTQTLPQDDKLSLSKERASNMIAMLMGGRLAEDLVFSHFTTGASNDIERATQIARRMVCEWGMSDLGPINYSGQQNQLMPYSEFSEQTKRDVDTEIKKIINEAYEKGKKILEDHKVQLDSLALLLLEKETLDSSEVDAILNVQPQA